MPAPAGAVPYRPAREAGPLATPGLSDNSAGRIIPAVMAAFSFSMRIFHFQQDSSMRPCSRNFTDAASRTAIMDNVCLMY